jgi:peptidoglycan/xylan/chitin deacetylase (PgdA/CDA1 family)
MANERLPLLPLILDGVPLGLRQALAQEGVPTHPWRPGPPQGRFLLFDSRMGKHELPAAGQIGIDVSPLRQGFREDPFEALTDERSAPSRWKIGGLVLSEEIARVDKRAVRRRVLEGLRAKIEKAGGIWLRVSPFPFPYRSALSFRIDYDEYDPQDFDATLEAVAGHEGATSHFVSGAAYEDAGEALARLRGLDVGSHGYRHHTYRTAEENLNNIGRGIEVLRGAGIEPSGFAAPHGRFHRQLLLALETLGITHSSEFGFAYDEVPVFLSASNLLQIPVHPVCLGLFLEAARRRGPRSSGPADAEIGAAVDRAIHYFDEAIRARYHSGEPALLYGHPTGRLGRHPQVVRRVFEVARACGALWKTTFSEMSRWWRARAQVRMTVSRYHDEYVLVVRRMAPGYRVGIEYFRARHVASVPLDRHVVRFSPSALGYERRGETPSVRPVRIDRPQGLRGRIRRLIDWERVTPIEEIAADGWRNWAKRSLRRLQGDGP